MGELGIVYSILYLVGFPALDPSTVSGSNLKGQKDD
jgi:hypothetical protein